MVAMRDLLTGTKTSLRLGASLAFAAALLSLGADSGYAARAHHGPRHTFTLSAAPRVVMLEPGQTARVRIVIHRRDLAGRVRFRLLTSLPAGISARFSRVRTRRHRTALILTADA